MIWKKTICLPNLLIKKKEVGIVKENFILSVWTKILLKATWKKPAAAVPVYGDGGVHPSDFLPRQISVQNNTGNEDEWLIEGKLYKKGTAPGSGNNCLTHSFAQLLDGLHPLFGENREDQVEVARQLRQLNRERVDNSNMLEVDEEWSHILRLYGFEPSNFTVWTLSKDHDGNGSFQGHGPVHLFLLNEGNQHFVPLLPNDLPPNPIAVCVNKLMQPCFRTCCLTWTICSILCFVSSSGTPKQYKHRSNAEITVTAYVKHYNYNDIILI